MNRIVPDGVAAPLAIVGTTASGKSALAMELARRRRDIELVSVDSMQVYRGMDIGTAKPTSEDQAEVRHHVIDLVDPWEHFDVRQFQSAVTDALADIAGRGRRAVLVGGTGLYLQAVVDGFEIPGRYPDVVPDQEDEPDTVALHRRLAELDPVAAGRMEPSNRRRVMRALEVTLGSGRPFSSFGPGTDAFPPTPVRLVGIRLPTEVVADRIARRYQQQMTAGFLDEVRALAAGPAISRTAAQALGYRELLAHLHRTEAIGSPGLTGRPEPAGSSDPVSGAHAAGSPDPDSDPDPVSGVDAAGSTDPTALSPDSLEDALLQAIHRTRRFARRQRSWFGRDPRITWLDAVHDPSAALGDLEAIAASHWD